MEGVQILNSFEYFQSEAQFGVCLIVCFVAISTLLALMQVREFKAAIIALAIVIISGFGVYTLSDNFITRYEAIINNNVSYTEILENYNIVEQRGNIFVLEEKSN